MGAEVESSFDSVSVSLPGLLLSLNMMPTRRTFLKCGATGAALTTVPPWLRAQREDMPRQSSPRAPTTTVSLLGDPNTKALAQKSIDAARGAGAQFADIRVTFTYNGSIGSSVWDIPSLGTVPSMTVGVRAMVNGYWGFAGGPVWNADEAVRLGRESVAQAKAIRIGPPRPLDLSTIPIVDDQQWIMPVKRDPWIVDRAEIMDFMNGLAVYVTRTKNAEPRERTFRVFKQDKAYANTEGSFWTQRTYRSSWVFKFQLEIDGRPWSTAIGVSPTGEGWECVSELPARDMIDQAFERLREDARLPFLPVDVGKYTVVLDASPVTGLLSETIGAATELDRIMGYEANAGGTSYVNDPHEMLGSFMVGSALLSVTGNRTATKSVATVRWDDDSVTPDEFPIVTAGRLTGVSSSRESTGWIKDVLSRSGTPVRSHGCAYAPRGVDTPLVHTPNLVMTPAEGADTLDTFLGGLSKGVFFEGMGLNMDFQKLNGMGWGKCYEIRNGKRSAHLLNAGVLFRTPELWKSLSAIGGRTSAKREGIGVTKGEPPQESFHSVTAVPIVVKDMTLIDIMRKA